MEDSLDQQDFFLVLSDTIQEIYEIKKLSSANLSKFTSIIDKEFERLFKRMASKDNGQL